MLRRSITNRRKRSRCTGIQLRHESLGVTAETILNVRLGAGLIQAVKLVARWLISQEVIERMKPEGLPPASRARGSAVKPQARARSRKI